MTVHLRRRAEGPELMDDLALPGERYAAVLQDLARVNVVTRAAAPTLWWLNRATRGMQAFTLLDVGFGHGDMLRHVARWARRRGVPATLIGVDRDPRSAPAARAATPPHLGITYITGDAANVGVVPDVVISSLVAHHMAEEELVSFLQWMECTVTRGWFINDLHRHWLAWRGYQVLAALMQVDPIVRHDGALSVRRGFRRGEWEALLEQAGVQGADIRWFLPFRLCVGRLR